MPARPTAVATPITVVRGARPRYHSLLHRADGVTVRLEGGSYNKVGGDERRGVPHDIAHCLVEEGLGLRAGLWGVLAAGGTVQNAEVVEGRQRPHAAERARAITQRASRRLWETEVVVRAVADLALSGARPDVAELVARCGGEYWPAGAATPAGLTELCAALREAAVRWWQLAPGDGYELVWQLPAPD